MIKQRTKNIATVCSVISVVSSIKDDIRLLQSVYTLAQSFLLSIFNDLVSNASGTVKSYYSVTQTAKTLKEADDIVSMS